MLGYSDLKEAVQTGMLGGINPDAIGFFSVDVAVDRLFRLKRITRTIDRSSLSQEDFIEHATDEVEDFENGVILQPGDYCLALTKEKIFLGKGFAGEITTRSSYARMGLMVTSQSDDYLTRYHQETNQKALIGISSSTNVKLKRGEPLAQLFVHSEKIPVFEGELEQLLKSGELIVRDPDSGNIIKTEYGAIELTMGEDIMLYNGKLIVPWEQNEGAFDPVRLSRIQPLLLKKGAFCISSSREHVEIPDDCIGLVTMRNCYERTKR